MLRIEDYYTMDEASWIIDHLSITKEEVADLFHVSRQTLYNWLAGNYKGTEVRTRQILTYVLDDYLRTVARRTDAEMIWIKDAAKKACKGEAS